MKEEVPHVLLFHAAPCPLDQRDAAASPHGSVPAKDAVAREQPLHEPAEVRWAGGARKDQVIGGDHPKILGPYTPHNNLAERVIRPAVLWHKSSFGTQNGQGSRFAECMLTVSQTLRLQDRSVLDFVERSIRAARRADAVPSLLHP